MQDSSIEQNEITLFEFDCNESQEMNNSFHMKFYYLDYILEILTF